MRIYDKIKIDIYKLIVGGMIRQLAFLFIFFVLVFTSLTFILNMDSSRLFHNMTSFDYPPKDNHLLLQLLYLIGVIFFSGFLVMVLTNSVRNKIELFKSGDIRLRLKNKISIIGYNDIALGIIKRMIGKANIEVIVENSVPNIREELDGLFGLDNGIYVFHASRTSQKDLASLHLNEALAIYIVGESEDNSDFKNLECFSELSKLKDYGRSKVFLLLQEQSSFTLFSNRSYNGDDALIDRYHVLNIMNSDESWARKILIDPDNVWPDRNLYMRGNKTPNVNSNYRVHILIFGMTTPGEIISKTVALSCHFPNYITNSIKTKITVIDEDFNKKRGIFGGRYSDYLKMCQYSIRSIRDGKSISISTHKPDSDQDLMDIEWEFIESVPDDILLQEELSQVCLNENEILTAIVCNENDSKNINIALGLPRVFFDNNIPIWLYLKSDFSLSRYLTGSRYDSIVPWGMLDSYPEQNGWIESTAKLFNYFYSTMDYNTYKNDHYSKASEEEINMDWNHLSIEMRINTINDTLGLPSILRCMKGQDINNRKLTHIYERVEHVRWMTSALLRGFRPLPPDLKKEYETNNRNIQYRRELRKQFYHPDIDNYERVREDLHEINISTIKFYKDLADKWEQCNGQHQNN